MTSQIFGNFFLNELDHAIKSDLGVRYYGRYVDDMIFLDADRTRLEEIYQYVSVYLVERLGCQLNHQKTHIGNIADGVEFLGVYITPYAEYVGKRTKKMQNRLFALSSLHLELRRDDPLWIVLVINLE